MNGDMLKTLAIPLAMIGMGKAGKVNSDVMMSWRKKEALELMKSPEGTEDKIGKTETERTDKGRRGTSLMDIIREIEIAMAKAKIMRETEIDVEMIETDIEMREMDTKITGTEVESHEGTDIEKQKETEGIEIEIEIGDNIHMYAQEGGI